jgi:tRNA(Ile)-lysidine synthase
MLGRVSNRNMMSLINQFKSYIHEQRLFESKDRLMLAVSGGVDSVVLCELCRLAGFDFIIAHCNFQLRDSESERDENFVRALGEKYSVPVLVEKFDAGKYARDQHVSIQVAARELRYHWFDQVLNGNWPGGTKMADTVGLQKPPAYLLTAHQEDDNIETVLMNLFKGTGMAGLRGILPKQGRIIRPLLFARKEALLSFAAHEKLHWVEDSSNVSDKYSRNYFRHQVIPLVAQEFPQALNNLAANIPRFREAELLYQQAVAIHKKKLLEPRGNEIHIPVLKLRKTVPLRTLLYEIVKDFGFSAHQSEEICRLLESETGKYVESSTHRIIKNRNWLIIAPLSNTEANHIIIEEAAGHVIFPLGSLEFRRKPNSQQSIPAASLIAILDAKRISFPLVLRKWKQGDYFYPLGMRRKKKVSRFLIDQKLSRTEKEKQWVLEADKKILWVIGQRIDDRFKVVEQTREIMQVTLKPR